ncbi:MAG: ATPase domain-containing protein [archaeon]|jgi:circadian clock protein KaiC
MVFMADEENEEKSEAERLLEEKMAQLRGTGTDIRTSRMEASKGSLDNAIQELKKSKVSFKESPKSAYSSSGSFDDKIKMFESIKESGNFDSALNVDSKKRENFSVRPVRLDNFDSEKPSFSGERKNEEGHETFERVRTGITGFDELIEGGFEKNSTVVVVGSAGTGKTLFGLQFIYEGIMKYDEPGMFISFSEDRESLYTHALQFGWDFAKLEKEGKFRLLLFKPHQMTKILEEGGAGIRDALVELGAKRVVVDSITVYGLLFKDEYEKRDKTLEFFNSLKKWDVTSLIISEESPEKLEGEEGGIGFIVDAIISLYYKHDEEKGIRIHALEVLKMRGTRHTNKICAINFEKNGIRVYPDVEIF